MKVKEVKRVEVAPVVNVQPEKEEVAVRRAEAPKPKVKAVKRVVTSHTIEQRRARIIEALRDNPKASCQVLADAVNSTKSTVYSDIKKLESVGTLVQYVNGNGKEWKVNE